MTEDEKKLSTVGISGSNAGKRLRDAIIKGDNKDYIGIAKEAHKYGSLLSAGNNAQVEKLEANSDKTGFDDIDIYYAVKRIREECHELFLEIHPNKDYEAIRQEAADVANFAHMIILKCDKELDK